MYRHINGHQAWVQHNGDAGPPILFIMGFGISGDGWQLQVEGLSPDHRVAWYDVRGLGRSNPGYGRLHLAGIDCDARLVRLGCRLATFPSNVIVRRSDRWRGEFTEL